MKNIKPILALTMCSLALSACSISFSKSATHIEEEEKMVSRMITPDYGQHIQNKVCMLFGTASIPFNLKDYGVDYIAAGDQLEIYFTGTWMELTIYPSQIVTKDITVKEIKVWHAEIIEFELVPTPGDSEHLELVPTNPEAWHGVCLETKVINEDRSFQELNTFQAATKIYGVIPATFDSFNVYALYSYNPSLLS